MGEFVKSDNVVLLFDNYGADSQKLHTSFRLAGKDYPVAVIDDDGFLPEGVLSVFGFFLGEFKKSDRVTGKPRYFNQIIVPEYWEISANNSKGQVHDLHREKARIFYAEPKHKRLVKAVDWYDDKGVVRSTDHYNRHGALYGRTIFNAKGQRVNKSYFDAEGREIIMENYVTKNIILNEGKQVHIFPNKTEFVFHFMKQAGFADDRVFFNTLSTSFFVSQRMNQEKKEDILFWQEAARNDIPGNMKVILEGKGTRTAKIMVQNKQAYEKLLAAGASAEMVKPLGYIYPFKKENGHKPEALICTNSDKVAELSVLVEALPEMHFHVAALTEMSSKLMSMDQYSNVSLYPAAKQKKIDELFETCDYYLDINHEAEIVSAVQTAFLHNHLILAFTETLHNANYVATEHVYAKDNVNWMIGCLKSVITDENKLKEHLKAQHNAAMAETMEIYLQM